MDQSKTVSSRYDYYRDLWENPQPAAILSCPAMWDERADEWVKLLRDDAAYRAHMMERVAATAGFLRQNGLLCPGSRVLDVGCGPGLFSAEFAKTAGHVTGVDISPRMARHAQNYARQQGQADNTTFLALDFKQESIESLGWYKQFDLVMTCITPAITSVADLYKVMDISRGHCLHVSFVEASDSLEQRIATELYGELPESFRHWDGRVFYSVFNLLFLQGYNPQTFYYRQAAEDEPELSESLAGRYARSLKKNGPEYEAETARIYDYLSGLHKKEGALHRSAVECYGFLLWDVNQKRPGRAGY